MKNKQLPSLAGIVALTIVVFLFVYINLLIKAIVTVFKYANWNQVFNEALKKVEGNQNTSDGSSKLVERDSSKVKQNITRRMETPRSEIKHG